MIKLYDLNRESVNMTPVTTPEYTTGKSLILHPAGVFSEVIFGPKDSHERHKHYSYINLNCKVLHPALVKPLYRMNRKILEAINRENTFRYDEATKTLVADPNGEINGLSSVIANFEKLMNKPETTKIRQDMLDMFMFYHSKGMVFIDKYIVIPAGYRDAQMDEISGGLRIPPINDYYSKIIKQSIQLESFAYQEGPIYDILSAKMQSLIDDLYNYIVLRISKKGGLIRQAMLGKRVDFSGRAVIGGASSSLKVNELGIPFRMAVKLFEPFILHDIHNTKNVDQKRMDQLLKEFNGTTFSIPAVRSLLVTIYRGYDVPPELLDIVRQSAERCVQGKVVLTKRDPALHAESVQGFYPVIMDGNTIRLNPLKCSGFNADFDGDQMAVYVPLTNESIQEVKDKFISSESKDAINSITDSFDKDIIAGLYVLTQDVEMINPRIIKDESEIYQMDPLTVIRYNGELTTAGKLIFNKILPDPHYWTQKPITKKSINSLAQTIYKDFKDKNVYVKFCDDAVKLSTKYFTLFAPSVGLDDLANLPPNLVKLKQQMHETSNLEEASALQDKMEVELKKHLESNGSGIGVLGKADALKGGYGQTRQIIMAKGLAAGMDGKTVNVASSYSDGFKSSEFFKDGYGSRAGVADRVLNTADTGYLSRILVYALQRVEADPSIRDCGSKQCFKLKVTPKWAKRLIGRYVVNDEGHTVPFDPARDVGNIIRLRSPLYCNTVQLCSKCYGDLLHRNRTRYVGIVAAEICGERLTQTIMRTFHTGGATSIKAFDIISNMATAISDSQKRFLTESFVQKENDLIANVECKLLIDCELYRKQAVNDIKLSETSIQLKYGYFNLKYLTFDLDLTLDNAIIINLKDKKVKQTGDIIEVVCPANSVVFSCPPTEEKFSEKLKMLNSLFRGRSPWKNTDHYCTKLLNMYDSIGTDADLVHFEVLASNLLRDASNPRYPARLNYKNYHPILKSPQDVPKLESWLQGLAFERPSDAITYGLLYDNPSDETIIETLITGSGS